MGWTWTDNLQVGRHRFSDINDPPSRGPFNQRPNPSGVQTGKRKQFNDQTKVNLVTAQRHRQFLKALAGENSSHFGHLAQGLFGERTGKTQHAVPLRCSEVNRGAEADARDRSAYPEGHLLPPLNSPAFQGSPGPAWPAYVCCPCMASLCWDTSGDGELTPSREFPERGLERLQAITAHILAENEAIIAHILAENVLLLRFAPLPLSRVTRVRDSRRAHSICSQYLIPSV